MEMMWYIRRIGQLLLSPRDAKRVLFATLPKKAKEAVLKRLCGVIHIGTRAVSRRIALRGARRTEKTFNADEVGTMCFERELLAHELFRDRPWMPPLLGKGDRLLIRPFYPDGARLDRVVSGMDEATRIAVAKQAGHMLFDLFLAGYAHRDFHAGNLFWVEGQLVLIDLEMLGQYPEGQRPAFPRSYDMTGEGLESPLSTGHMCYGHPSHEMAVGRVLGVPPKQLLEGLQAELIGSLEDVSQTFKTHGWRPTGRAGRRIYCSFDLPYLSVPDAEAERDSTRRFAKLGITADTLRGKRALDLGCHFGGMVFACQRFGPRSCVGVEYDADKVEVARRIAAYNGLNHVQFVHGNIDKLTPKELGEPFDVVFCLAVEGHVNRKDRLYRLLGQITKELLFFEGNSTSNVDSIRSGLSENGFRCVEYLGSCDDDYLQDNNCRPVFVARK
jgi:hypothetical protein